MKSSDIADVIRGRLHPGAPQTDNAPVLQPPQIADHVVLCRIGGGSYGDVWLARGITGQLRAIKVVWRRNFSSDRPYEREFHGIVQFEPISRSHPAVVNVLHVGRDDAAGCFFYVMELADAANLKAQGSKLKAQSSEGQKSEQVQLPGLALNVEQDFAGAYVPRTLSSDLKFSGRLPISDVLRLGVQLADALGHLHRHQLVHRDVKPSNVIFVGGQPKLADIGLVTSIQEARSFVGTEGFIPPEGPGTKKADLFGLGRLLYEAATGKDRCEFPQLPGDLENWLPPEREALLELNEVLAKLCAPELADRHENAAEVAGDLNLILAGRSVRRAYGIERRLRRATQISVAALGVVTLAAGVIWFQRSQQQRAETRAVQERALRQRAEAAEHGMEQQLYTALLEQARATVLSGELGQRVRALEAVHRAGNISNSAALRGVALAAYALPDLRFERELPYGAAFTLRLPDPSFERIALCCGRGPVEIRSMFDQRLLATLPASTNLPAYVAEWSPDRRFLAVKREYDSGVERADKEVWSVADARRVLLLKDAPYDAMSFHPRLPRFLVARTNGVALWDLESSSELARIRLNGVPQWLRFAPDGESFGASYGVESNWFVSMHRITGELVASAVFDKDVDSFVWHPSGKWIAVVDFGGSVFRLDAQTGEKRLLGRHKATATEAQFSPDGAYLITGGWERELICWDARTLRRAFNVFLNGYVGRFRSDGMAYALETETGLQLHTFEQASGQREFAEDLGPLLRHAAFSPDSRWLAAAGTERVEVWDLQSAGPGALATTALATNWPPEVCFANNGELFAYRSGACFRWRVLPGTNADSPPQLLPLELAFPKRFHSLCVVSNGIVMNAESGLALIGKGELGMGPLEWKRSADGTIGASPELATGSMNASGRWVALFAAWTPYLFVHRLPDLERVAILTNASNISSFDFSPKGDELAVSCRLGVEFWNTATWQRTRAITNLNHQLYSTDGRTMWLTPELRAGGLYDTRTLKLLMSLPVGAFPLAVSPDGRRLAVSVDFRRLQVWDLVEVRERLRELRLDWGERRQ